MKKLISIPFEEEYIAINENNSIMQYMLHYKTEGAPIILFIHGGPGMSQSCFGYFLKEMFKDRFSFVFYDQRGAGRTYIKNPKLVPTLELQMEDLHNTILYLKQKYKTEKVIIMGHSWGSVLGYIYSRRYPENLTHFISIGQVCDMSESENISMQKLRQLIKINGSKSDQKKLKDIGNYPNGEWNDKTIQLYKKVDKLKGKYKLIFSKDISLSKIARKTPTKFRLKDVIAMFKTEKVNRTMLMDAMNEFSPQKYGTCFQIPILFIMGENDFVTPLETFKPLYKIISSPKKELIVIENSGHMIPFEQPTKFATAVINFIK